MYNIQQNISSVDGLSYIPHFEIEAENDIDDMGINSVEIEFSKGNQDILRECVLRIKPKAILEIGVQRNIHNSSTDIFFDNKSDDCVYIGVDIENKQYLNNREKNIHVIHSDSSNYDKIFEVMKDLNVEKFDIIFIDGLHSINQMLKDWKYVEKLSDNGCVLVHDTNKHPGPVCVFDAIDENKYIKKKFCEQDNDHGIAVIIKKPKVDL